MGEQMSFNLDMAAIRATPPKTIDEVDQWLERYLASVDAARDVAIRLETLQDAAPDMLKACQALISWSDSNTPDGEELYCVKLAREAVAKALTPNVK